MKDKVLTFLLKALPWILCVVLCVGLVRACNAERSAEEQNEHNIIALTDSVKYYKDKFGQEVATKTILIGDLKTLQLANDSLVEKVKAMMGKEKPQQVIYITNEIVNEKHDTCWRNPSLVNPFDFSNKWRVLSGNVILKDSVLGLSIDKDIVNADFTIALKDGKAWVSSSNPYVHVNDIQGFTLPKPKNKHWHIGPYVGVGLGEDLKIHPTVGAGVTYSILSW